MVKASGTQKKQAFAADERNSGGRTQITQLLYNHYNALINTKPTIKVGQETTSMAQCNPNIKNGANTYKSTRNGAPKTTDNTRQKSSKIRRPQSKASKNSMAGTSARNINEFNSTNNIRPQSAQNHGKYRGRNYKMDDHINREHNLNLKSQYKKISEMGYGYNEQKKKPYDPVANPALIFKRKKPRGMSSELSGPGPSSKQHLYESQPNPNMNQHYNHNGYNAAPKISRSIKTNPKTRPMVQSAHTHQPAPRRQRIYRTEFGDLTEDELRDVLKLQQAELERLEMEKLKKKKAAKKRKVAKPVNKRETPDVP